MRLFPKAKLRKHLTESIGVQAHILIVNAGFVDAMLNPNDIRVWLF